MCNGCTQPEFPGGGVREFACVAGLLPSQFWEPPTVFSTCPSSQPKPRPVSIAIHRLKGEQGHIGDAGRFGRNFERLRPRLGNFGHFQASTLSLSPPRPMRTEEHARSAPRLASSEPPPTADAPKRQRALCIWYGGSEPTALLQSDRPGLAGRALTAAWRHLLPPQFGAALQAAPTKRVPAAPPRHLLGPSPSIFNPTPRHPTTHLGFEPMTLSLEVRCSNHPRTDPRRMLSECWKNAAALSGGRREQLQDKCSRKCCPPGVAPKSSKDARKSDFRALDAVFLG